MPPISSQIGVFACRRKNLSRTAGHAYRIYIFYRNNIFFVLSYLNQQVRA